MPRLLTRLLALLAVAALAMGACGNDDDDPAPTTEAPSAEDGDETSDDDQEPDPEPDDTTTTTSSDSADPADGLDFAGAETACEVLVSFAAFAELIDDAFDDLDGREADRAFAAGQAAYARAGELGPEELADDFATIAAGFAEFRALFAEFDYDIDALEAAEDEDPERFADTIIESTDFVLAFAATSAYAENECGIE